MGARRTSSSSAASSGFGVGADGAGGGGVEGVGVDSGAGVARVEDWGAGEVRRAAADFGEGGARDAARDAEGGGGDGERDTSETLSSLSSSCLSSLVRWKRVREVTVCRECSHLPETRGEYLQRRGTRAAVRFWPSHGNRIPPCDGFCRHFPRLT